ncbi:MAG: phosphoribosylaminoimidazolesuccinocarboxamide synthase [Saprospirales bacterium]|nr:MAG: phosphoribosylaminoimidazolesuccinocarboxamide synthase [Saprospirales bacterium]
MSTQKLAALSETNFQLPHQTGFHRGKVRDVYFFEKKIAAVATDRISAFDCILPAPIPSKGQVLNQMAAFFLEKCRDIVPVWLESLPDPNVSVGRRCEPIKLEMVIRGYLAGHAWRLYEGGSRKICGELMPNGMSESEPFPVPIITPATKADEGHDEDISINEILSRKLLDKNLLDQLLETTRMLYQFGTKMAAERGLILVDTKYEFGLDANGTLTLIDEVHTPDSSRYFIAEDYEKCLSAGRPQNHLSKEFVREWLMSQGFQGKDGQAMPAMNEEVVSRIRDKYIRLFEIMTGKSFIPDSSGNVLKRVESNLLKWCESVRP